MTALLDRIDNVFGDAGQGQDWVARVFGLTRAYPIWTAKSLEVCCTLALLYPFAGMILVWVLVGDTGAIGSYLGFVPTADAQHRLVVCFISIPIGIAVARLVIGRTLLTLFAFVIVAQISFFLLSALFPSVASLISDLASKSLITVIILGPFLLRHSNERGVSAGFLIGFLFLSIFAEIFRIEIHPPSSIILS